MVQLTPLPPHHPPWSGWNTKLDIPDHIYKWLTDFFTGHSDQTHYGGSVSQIQCILASIIQGSAVGPTSYVANASHLHTIYHGNELCKYADDTYLIVPASNVDTRTAELKNITDWATINNLSLNLSKSEEIVFIDSQQTSSCSPVSFSRLQLPNSWNVKWPNTYPAY